MTAAPSHAGHAARVIAAAALFSTAGTAIKATTLTSWQVAGLRAGFATIAVLFLLPETRRRFSPRAALVGLVYSATVILFAQANKLTTAANAIFIQSTSPLYARQSFWCVVATLEDVGLRTAPYHALVPSFGEWGFIIASREAYAPPRIDPDKTRFLTPETTAALFHFPADMARQPAEVNRLNNQVLVRYFEAEWGAVTR